MSTVPETEWETNTMTPPPAREAFRQAVAQVAAKAHEKLPQCTGRIDSAVKIVLAGDVHLLPGGGARVASRSDAELTYLTVNGHCDCKDFARAPEGLCAHRLAYGILRRASELVPQGPLVETEPTAEAVHGIPAQYLHRIQGQLAIKYAGLLHLASVAGLQSLTADWLHNDAELSLAKAVAVFADGRRFEECGDSTPQNAARVKLHWRRLALTRAKARALRDALNIGLVTAEELDE